MWHLGVTPSRAAAVLSLLLALITGCAGTPPAINVNSEPTDDGLYEVSGTDADQAWARPDVDMAQYSKIMVRGIGIEYRPGGESRRTRIARRSGGPFEVTEQQKEQFRAIAEEEILEEFAESGRFTLVDGPGSGVLLVTVHLMDVVSFIPPNAPGRDNVYSNEVGEATLILELRDSMTETVLARAVDRRTAENIDKRAQWTVAATNTTEVRRLFRTFARILRQQLDDFGGLGT